ncbi:MAG: ABC transporter substrate-binding protein [Lachnospiraceae bacterium]
MKHTKKIMTCFLAALTLCTLSGCQKEEEDNSIYLLSFKPEVATTWKEIADTYEKETGVHVKILTSTNGNHDKNLKSEIAKQDAPTLFQINGQPEYEIWKNYCLDLKDTKLYSWLLDKDMAISHDGGVCGIPYVVEGYGIIYNQVIMDKYFSLPSKETSYKSMDEIRSFETLKAVVEDMTRHTSELGISGVFASTSLAPGEDWRWQTHLSNLPFYYELQDKGVYETDTIDFTYEKEYKNIFDLYIHNSCTIPKDLGKKNVTDSMNEFALGKVAMVQNGNWAWNQISEVEGNIVKEDDIKFLPIYTGMKGEESQGLCIGTENYICVNALASPEKQKNSIAFLEWLYSSKEGKQFVTEKLGFIPPFDTFTEEEYPKNPLAQEVMRYMNDQNLHSVNWVFSAYPNQAFKDNLGTNLLSYCKGTMNWETLVDKTKTDWAAQIKTAAEEDE